MEENLDPKAFLDYFRSSIDGPFEDFNEKIKIVLDKTGGTMPFN